MNTHSAPSNDHFVRNAVEAAIRIGVLFLIFSWCFQIARPFISIIVWGVIIAVAVFPLYERLKGRLGGRNKLSATMISLLLLILLVGPCVMISEIMVENVQSVSTNIENGSLDIPSPPPEVAEWPFVGKSLHKIWSIADTNIEQALTMLEPQLKAAGKWLLGAAAGAGMMLLGLIAAIVIAGILLAFSAGGAKLAQDIAARLTGDRNTDLIKLADNTIRSVAKGVLGVAFIQAVLSGIGLVVAGVPGAGLLAFMCLLLAIIQLPIALVMLPAAGYMFYTADTLWASIFLVYAILVSGSDNVLKPLLLGRGVSTPIAIILIGTIGGMLLSGFIGLFIGAVILALGYELFMAWLADGKPQADPQT
ncbi:MAG: AI-2E family transporter [Gammaproteobacteria bacterium]|nr:AI-2E family transporter [Gammaproteobacteria bacterium]